MHARTYPAVLIKQEFFGSDDDEAAEPAGMVNKT